MDIKLMLLMVSQRDDWLNMGSLHSNHSPSAAQ